MRAWRGALLCDRDEIAASGCSAPLHNKPRSGLDLRRCLETYRLGHHGKVAAREDLSVCGPHVPQLELAGTPWCAQAQWISFASWGPLEIILVLRFGFGDAEIVLGSIRPRPGDFELLTSRDFGGALESRQDLENLEGGAREYLSQARYPAQSARRGSRGLQRRLECTPRSPPSVRR